MRGTSLIPIAADAKLGKGITAENIHKAPNRGILVRNKARRL